MPRGTTFRTWDDYFIPGTSVLRNKFTAPGKPHGEPDPDKLRTLEEAFAHTRLQELHENPIAGRFDYDHMKAIHGYVFQDVYEWAGQERVAPAGQFMTKDGHAYYGAGPHLTAAAEAEYAKLAGKDFLRGLPQARFVDEFAESWGELNVIHFAREGNTRTQFVFFSQLAEQAGYRIDATQFAPGSPLRDEFIQARFHSQDTGRNDQLAAVLEKAITPLGHDASASRRRSVATEAEPTQDGADVISPMTTRLDIEQRWPELFDGLTELQRWSVAQSLAAAWHEGWEPNRADVANLTEYAAGRIDHAEYTRRSHAAAERSRGSVE